LFASTRVILGDIIEDRSRHREWAVAGVQPHTIVQICRLAPLVQKQFRAFSALKCHNTGRPWPWAWLAMRWAAVAFVAVCAAVVRIRRTGEARDRIQYVLAGYGASLDIRIVMPWR